MWLFVSRKKGGGGGRLGVHRRYWMNFYLPLLFCRPVCATLLCPSSHQVVAWAVVAVVFLLGWDLPRRYLSAANDIYIYIKMWYFRFSNNVLAVIIHIFSPNLSFFLVFRYFFSFLGIWICSTGCYNGKRGHRPPHAVRAGVCSWRINPWSRAAPGRPQLTHFQLNRACI